ncbi:MAG TPA: hypothetical protein VJ577_05320 [Burkholderiaceae bacterium]|nr:hypothetical protein [Burkholderiaceae bacterium]
MKIEEEFRDFKNEYVGLDFSVNCSEYGEWLSVLLLITCLASFLLRLIDEYSVCIKWSRSANTMPAGHVLFCSSSIWHDNWHARAGYLPLL